MSFDHVPDDFGEPVTGGVESSATPREKYLHPWAVVFHLLFKVLCLIVYLVLSLALGGFQNMFIITFIVVVLLLACDFWTVKNVSGRLLVGLRWWNQIDEDGESKWIFESREDRTRVHRGEASVFWGGLGIFTAFWFAFALKNAITLRGGWLIIDIVGLSLSGANLTGYLKCAKAAGSLKAAAGRYAVNYAVDQAVGGNEQ